MNAIPKVLLASAAWALALNAPAPSSDAWQANAGFSLNYSRNRLDFYAPGADIEENSWFLSGRKYFIDDSNGTLTLRLDGYWVDDSKQTESENDVWTVAPQISFINGSRTAS